MSASRATSATTPDLAAPLPVDATVIRGSLANGVRYWIAPNHASHDAAIWMRIGAGSLHERAGEEGLAHYVEHMAFRGTRHFPHDTVTRRLESLGLTFGTDENASTTLRATTYKLNLPNSSAAALSEAMTVLADFAYRRAATTVDVARERPVIMEEQRAADTLGARVDRRLFRAIFTGTRTAGHLPLGKRSVVENVTREAIDAFVARWYRPEKTTLIATGDVDPAVVLDLIRREFEPFHAADPAPPEPAPLEGLDEAARTIVVADPEQMSAQLRIVGPAVLHGESTIGDSRQRLVRQLAVWLVDERLHAELDLGAPFASARAELEASLAGALSAVVIDGTAPAAAWRRLVTSVAGALSAMLRDGFTPAELEEAREALLSDARSRSAMAPTRTAARMAAELETDVALEQPPSSAADRFELVRALLPQIDGDEIRSSLRQALDQQHRLVALIVPARADFQPPTAARVASVARAATPQAAHAGPLVTGIPRLPEDPQPGEIVEERTAPDTGTTSLTLSNGVRVHLRPMTERRDEVRVVVTLAGGELLETASTRGLSEAAAVAFDSPSTAELSAPELRAALAGRDIDLSGCACDADAITGELVTGRADLEAGMRLLHLVLSRGRVTPAAFDLWRTRALEWVAKAKRSPEARLADDLPALVIGRDPRLLPLTLAQIERVDLTKAQAWLERHRDEAPIEVAMVGDADEQELVRLARKYLGSLPPRPRRAQRVEAPTASVPALATDTVSVSVDAVAERAAVDVAWKLPDTLPPSDADAIDLGGAVLTARLRDELRQRRGWTYDVSLDTVPTSGFRGGRAMTVALSTEPRHAAEAALLIRRVVARLLSTGPTEEELATAKRQVSSARTDDARRPAAWAEALSNSDVDDGALEALSHPNRADDTSVDAFRAAFSRLLAGPGPITALAMPNPLVVLHTRKAPARAPDARAR